MLLCMKIMYQRSTLNHETTQDSCSKRVSNYSVTLLSGRFVRTGFTMVEVIIVIVILGVLSTLVSMRLSNNLGRRAELVFRRVEIILETMAHKQMIDQNLMRLVYSEQTQTMSLEVLSQWDDEETPSWKQDLMSNPVVFDDEDIIFQAAIFDGEEYRNQDFTILLPVNDARPAIVFEFAYGDLTESIELLPHDIRPRRMSDLDYDFNRLKPVDLDEIGKSEDKWDI